MGFGWVWGAGEGLLTGGLLLSTARVWDTAPARGKTKVS